MRRIFLLMGILLTGITGFTQTANTYSFATSTGATLDPMTGATTISPADRDDGVSAVQTIPFTFVYEGVNYSALSVSVDGWLKLGGTAGASEFSNSITSTTNVPKLFPLWDDLALGASNGTLSVLTTGSAPNRIYKVQWFVTIPRSTGGTANSTFQCWLYEGTNVIEFRYGAGGTPGSASSGIGGATASNFQSISTNTHTVSTSTANNSVATWPGSGRMYTFTPPLPCAGTPPTPTVPASIGFCLPSGTVTIPAGNLSTGVTGITYQWEESDDNGVGDPWGNAVGGTGATTPTYTSPTLSAAIYYRLRVTCANGGAQSFSAAIPVTPVNCSFNITRSTTSYNSIAATGTSATGWRNGNNTDDNMSTAQPIGFSFNYKGTDYTQFLVSTSGFITFNTGTAALGNGTGAYGYENTNFSSTTGTLNAIAPFYEDQVTPGNPTTAAGLANAMKYEVSGTAPNRVLTVEWIGMETFNNAGPNLNYQVKLYETSNVIEFVYGTMELFNGTANFGYSYTVGVNGPTMSASPTVAQLQTQQLDNEQNFSNVAKNNLDRYIDCNVKYTFTPGTYSGAATPPTLANDEPASATIIGVNNSPCTNLCGTYNTTNGATASAGITACGAVTPGTPDDDVWFRFNATTAQQTITVRSGGGFDAVVQLFSDAGITPITCVNATGAGLTETINATGLTPGATYYIRIYHSGTGSNNTGAGTGNTTTGGVPDFSLCVNEVVPPPSNDNACGAHPLTVSSGVCNAYSDNVLGGKTQFITATSSVGTNGVTNPICTGAGVAQDVWFSFVAPACDAVIIKTTPVAGVNTAFEIDSVVSGSCGTSDLILGVKSCTNIASTAQVDSLVFTSFIPGNTYYVRVYHHPSGQGGAPVSNSQFSICLYTPAAPSCTTNNTPANAATNVSATPVLNWNAAPGATSYDVYLDTNNPPTTLAATVTGTSYTVSPALSYTTTYYWYVVPKNCAGAATGCSSNATSFTTTTAPPSNDECAGAITVTTQPNAPTCSGTTSVNTTSATLSTNTSGCWSTSNNDDVWYRFVATNSTVIINVSNYTVTSGSAPDLAYVLYNDSLDCNNVNTAHELTTLCPVLTPVSGSGTASFSGLIVGNTYTLRLFTSGSGNSASFDFCLMDPPLPPSCTTNLTPANGATNQLTPITLSWNPAATATSYTVFIGTSNPPTAADSLTTVTGTSVTLINAASNTTYYWFVTPKNTGGAASGCNASTTSFTTGLIYCTPSYTNNVCVSGDSLTYFSLKGEGGTQIVNASGGACGTLNYSDYTAIGSADLYPSKTYTGKLKVNPGFSEGVTMWIDFNDNGLFESTEKVLNHLSVAPADGQLLYGIYIPIGSATGTHRMRVRTVFGNAGTNIDPCANYGYGETEDYTVNILSTAVTPYAVSAPPAPGTCVTGAIMTLDSLSNNRNVLVPILDSFNNVIAGINANNQNLGRVTPQYYLHNSLNGTNTRQDAVAGGPPTPAYYMDRNVRLSVATAPASAVNVRLFFTAADLANYNVAVPGTTTGMLNIHKTNQNFCATQAAGDSLFIAQLGAGTLGSDHFVDLTTPSFSNFYLFRGAAVLPISLADIYGRVTGASNTVYWTTAQEQNSNRFVVERSLNGRDFSAIGQLPTQALNGNSSTPLRYSFADAAPVNGKSFYRLRIIDNNGRETLSTIVTLLRGSGKFEVVDVRPNPTSNVVYFNVIGGSDNITLTLRSLDGRQVMSRKVTAGNAGYSLDLSAQAAGMYMLEAVDVSGMKATFKIVKQ